jgi:hypothetical protein
MRSRLHRRLLRRRSKLRNLTGWFSTLVYAPGRWFHRTGLNPTYQFFVTWRTTAMKRPNAAEAKPKDVKPGEALARLAATGSSRVGASNQESETSNVYAETDIADGYATGSNP